MSCCEPNLPPITTGTITGNAGSPNIVPFGEKQIPFAATAKRARNVGMVSSSFGIELLPTGRERLEQGGLPALPHTEHCYTGKDFEVALQQWLSGAFHTMQYQSSSLILQGLETPRRQQQLFPGAAKPHCTSCGVQHAFFTRQFSGALHRSTVHSRSVYARLITCATLSSAELQ